MKLDRVIQVGLLSAFSFSSVLLTSCDGSSSSSDDSGDVFPDDPNAGDMIEIRGSGGPTLTIIDNDDLSYATDTSVQEAKYDYMRQGSNYVIDLEFDDAKEGGVAVIALNQAIANPNSSLSDLIFSENPTNAELNFFVKAVENANVDVILDFDRDFNLFVQDSFRLVLPKSGNGTVENVISGEGIVLILGNGGKLVAVQEDGSNREFKFKYKEGEGVNYIEAR